MSDKVKLKKVTADNWEAVADLKLSADQEALVATNLYSIAESQFDPDARPRAIFVGERIVGFLMYDAGRPRDNPREALIYRFMIDRTHQGEGYGRAALEKAAGPRRKLIVLTVDAPVQLYGGEAIRRGDKVLGVTSSAGWGHTIGKAIAFGYVPSEDAGHADYEIEAFTRRHPAVRIDGAAVDPARRKLLA